MYRFLDSWVVERTLFEFVNTGGCSCCGFQHSGMTAKEFMELCSDVETDDGKKEQKSLWPRFMQDDVWAERVKFRRILKNDMPKYKSRMEGESGLAFANWYYSLTDKQRLACFQMPKEELHVLFNTVFGFKPAYQVVLCAVLEQVEKFDATGYACDGATDGELGFEVALLGKKGAFIVDAEYVSVDSGGCDLFIEMLQNLGGPHLLPVRPRELRAEAELAREKAEKNDTKIKELASMKNTSWNSQSSDSGSTSSSTTADDERSKGSDSHVKDDEDPDDDPDEDADEDDDDDEMPSSKKKPSASGSEKKEKPAKKSEFEGGDKDDSGPGQSFRSDRRLVRLCIFRYFADVIWRKFENAGGVSKWRDAEAPETESQGELPAVTDSSKPGGELGQAELNKEAPVASAVATAPPPVQAATPVAPDASSVSSPKKKEGKSPQKEPSAPLSPTSKQQQQNQNKPAQPPPLQQQQQPQPKGAFSGLKKGFLL